MVLPHMISSQLRQVQFSFSNTISIIATYSIKHNRIMVIYNDDFGSYKLILILKGLYTA